VLLVPEIMHEREPEVFLQSSKAGMLPYDLYCDIKPQLNKQTKPLKFIIRGKISLLFDNKNTF
jgi:hypothetical protein